MDATDTKEAELLYADLPSQGEIPEVDQPPSTPVTISAPTTNIPSSAFKVGESSRAQVVIPSSEPVIPPSLLEEGEALTRQQRQRSLQQRYMASRLRTAFLEDIQKNIFVSRRTTLNIYAILGVEKESEAYQHEYLAFIKYQRRRNNTVNSPHLIVRVLSVTICKFMNIWYPNLEVERRDCKRYIFSEVDFVDLSIDDIDFLYDHFRNLYHRTQDVSQTLFNLESYPLFTIIEDPFGVVYKNNSSEKCFLRFDEVGYYSDGTLKVIKLQLEHRLQEARRNTLSLSRFSLYDLGSSLPYPLPQLQPLGKDLLICILHALPAVENEKFCKPMVEYQSREDASSETHNPKHVETGAKVERTRLDRKKEIKENGAVLNQKQSRSLVARGVRLNTEGHGIKSCRTPFEKIMP
ncbi:hypothetical protein L6452_02324 [Arctium lappa]|uniref:Uncharacterized protein n=1 Tax=Arctium lappa TaxID=4217 RepID=A0ACB9FJ38_ARCLA|nr:hypothetical protein L6452_02324 [Arctium lappa]